MRPAEIADRGLDIPLVQGGMGAQDVSRAFTLGADGVQAALRFVTTEECDAAPAYKQAQEEDIAIIHNPAGMFGCTLQNAFIRRMEDEQEKITGCYNWLKACAPATAPYCIAQAPVNTVKGDTDNGLAFCGAHGRDRQDQVRERRARGTGPALKRAGK